MIARHVCRLIHQPVHQRCGETSKTPQVLGPFSECFGSKERTQSQTCWDCLEGGTSDQPLWTALRLKKYATPCRHHLTSRLVAVRLESGQEPGRSFQYLGGFLKNVQTACF